VLTPDQFLLAANQDFADNTYQKIRPSTFRKFAANIRATFVALAAVNVPDYELGRYYTAGFLIRHSFAGATAVFLEATGDGLLPAPTAAAGDDNWRAALSPASGPGLSQVGTVEALRRAQGSWEPNRLYIITNRVAPGTGQALPDALVRALSSSELEPEGYIIDATALVPAPARVRYDLATDTAGPVPPPIDAYSKLENNALLNQKADLVQRRVPEYQLPTRAVGNVDYRNRLRANTGTITILGGSYWHVAGEVTLDLRNLVQEDIFFLRISSFASASVWTRLLATDGKVIGAYPQGTALLFRRSGTEPADLAVITVSSEYPSYANAFVPLSIESAVAGGDWDASNRLTTTPAGSVATMQFHDENYLYFCFLEAQVQNGVLTYAWFRVPRTATGPGGQVSSGTTYFKVNGGYESGAISTKIQIGRSYFATVMLDEVLYSVIDSQSAASGWDGSSYPIPSDGLYELIGKVRIGDNYQTNVGAGSGYGVGVGLVDVNDNTDFAWFVTNPNRNSAAVNTSMYCKKGDRIRLYVYFDGFSANLGGMLSVRKIGSAL